MEIEEIFDKLKTGRFLHRLTNVTYPLHNSNFFLTSTRSALFNFSNSSFFIRLLLLSDINVARIIGILTSFVTYSNITNKECKNFESLPDILINIYKESRADSSG